MKLFETIKRKFVKFFCNHTQAYTDNVVDGRDKKHLICCKRCGKVIHKIHMGVHTKSNSHWY